MKNRITHRQLKKDFEKQLVCAESDTAFQPILDLPERMSYNALLSLFYNKNEIVRCRAVSAVGKVINQLAQKNIESARVIMRRLMWTLNDESGGIGWGAPEAMGDSMARNPKIAQEYHHILLSYMIEDQNYLEHELLQRGLLWGVGRLSHTYPEYVKPVAVHLNPFLTSSDPMHRGLALWAALPLHQPVNLSHISDLIKDTSTFIMYGDDYALKEICTADLAKQAMKKDQLD